MQLSPRESEVVALVCQGKLNKEIAYELGLALPTIKFYLYRIFRKTGARNRTALALMFAASMLAGCARRVELPPAPPRPSFDIEMLLARKVALQDAVVACVGDASERCGQVRAEYLSATREWSEAANRALRR